MSLLVLGLLDEYHSLDACSPVLDDTINECESVSEESLVGVDLLNDGEQNAEKSLAGLVVVENLGALTLLIEVLELSDSLD